MFFFWRNTLADTSRVKGKTPIRKALNPVLNPESTPEKESPQGRSWQRSVPWKVPQAVGAIAAVVTAFASPAAAAERIFASYAILERSISVSALETYAKEGKIEEDLAVYAQFIPPETLEQLPEILLARADIDPVIISQFLYTRQGEVLLQRLGEVIQSGSRVEGSYGLRAALILAAADEEGLTLLNVMRKFPTPEMRIDLLRAIEMAEELQGLVEQSSKAIDGVMNLARQQARAELDLLPDTQFPLEESGDLSWRKRSFRLKDRFRKTADTPKGRYVDVDLYLPEVSNSLSPTGQPNPTIVISHGLGSDRTTFAYLAAHLASHGFAVVVPQHPGSDARQLEALLTGAAQEVTKSIEFVDRPLDITFVLDELERLSKQDPQLKGQLSLERVGVLGQSFGGYTSLVLAGAPIDFDRLDADCAREEESWNVSIFLQCRALDLPRENYQLQDDRIAAAIVINPIDSAVLGPDSLSQIEIPIVVVAGGMDTVAPALAEQILPFTWFRAPEKYLILMQTGTHFSTLAESPSEEGVSIKYPPEVIGPNPLLAQRYTKAFSLAFFQTHINGRSEFEPYLSSAYIDAISQDPIPMGLLRFLDAIELDALLR
ncbi:MAG: alpha/beta hydrolase [Cyanobacteriota bacterium]|nr:alpha/beta hydrolase [Cyanobacteriota bacterium]